MRSSTRFCRAIGSIAVIAAFVSPAAHAMQQPSITVGPNVQVSTPFANQPHYEVLAASDPVHSGRMIACSHVSRQEPARTAQICYVTFDAGRTWVTSMQLERSRLNGDPAAVYGRGDTVFVAALGGGDSTEMGTRVYRSIDAGRTWQPNPFFLPFMDREYLSVDRTGKFPGRIYMHGTGSGLGIDGSGRTSGVRLYVSSDGGTTFTGPRERFFGLSGFGLGAENSNTVLTDGTFAAFFGVTKAGRSQGIPLAERDLPPNAELYVVTSKDGGWSLDQPVKIADWRQDRPKSEGAVLGQLTSDPSSGPYRDRMYAVYTENVDDRLQIRLVYSADKGKTWSAPRTMNDEPRTPASTANHILPAVAVNNNGVVFVCWYDRREQPNGSGWRIRGTASFDGGDTWLPSAAISDRPHALTAKSMLDIRGTGGRGGGGGRGGAGARPTGAPIDLSFSVESFLLAGGHTTGLVADADGVFHPIWVDNRTGLSQIWTAPVTVNGTVVKNGVAELAGLEDVSDRVSFDFTTVRFDLNTNTMSATTRLKNTSKDTLRAPFKARVIDLGSQIGTATIVGAENGLTGVGAIWNLSSLVPSGVLLPNDSSSASMDLRFIVSDRQALVDGERRSSPRTMASAKVRVFAKAAPPKAAAPPRP